MTQSRKKQTTTNTPPKTTTVSTTNTPPETTRSTKTKFFLVMTDTFRLGGFTLPKELSWEIDVREITEDGYSRKGTKIPPEYFKIKKVTIKHTEERTEKEFSWTDEEATKAWAVVGKYIQDRR